MTDRFSDRATSLSGPAGGGFAITPDDVSQMSEVTRAIYIGNGGTLVVELVRGGELTFENVPSGSIIPLRATKVKTASTCSSLIGLA